jgi:hypothetical protein
MQAMLTHCGRGILNNDMPSSQGLEPSNLTFALFILKIHIKSPNYLYELKFLGNTKAPSNA